MQKRLEIFWLSNQWQIYFWLSTVLALWLRLVLLPFESGDMKVFLIPWLEFLRNHDGFLGLSQAFSNYNPPYLYLLALVSYLPNWIPAATCVKLVGIPFDILNAFLVAKLLQRCGRSVQVQTLAYFVMLFLPTPLLNSGVWGQCDGIYTSFLLMSLYFICAKLPSKAMIFFGMALSFKLQALFFAPALFALWLSRRISVRHFFVIPIVFLCSLLPAFAFGRSFASLFSVYAEQAGYYKSLSLNAPNLYLWFSDGDPYRRIADTYYDLLTPAGYIISIAFVLFFGFALLNRKRDLSAEIIVTISFVSVLVTPFLLPKMHDRYFYPADVFSVVFAFFYPQFFFVPMLMQLASLSVYLNVLFRSTLLTPYWAALVVAMIICITMRHFLKCIWSKEEIVAAKPNVEISHETNKQDRGPFFLDERKIISFFVIFAVFLAFKLPYSTSNNIPDLYVAVETQGKPILEKLKAVTARQDWGMPRYGADLNGNPLLVGGLKYDDAICVHASSQVTFDLSSNFHVFAGAAALPDYLVSQQAVTAVNFKVAGDGRTLWESGPITAKSEGSKLFPFLVDTSGIKTLSLILEPASSGIVSDHGCWVLSKLTRK